MAWLASWVDIYFFGRGPGAHCRISLIHAAVGLVDLFDWLKTFATTSGAILQYVGKFTCVLHVKKGCFLQDNIASRTSFCAH